MKDAKKRRFRFFALHHALANPEIYFGGAESVSGMNFSKQTSKRYFRILCKTISFWALMLRNPPPHGVVSTYKTILG